MKHYVLLPFTCVGHHFLRKFSFYRPELIWRHYAIGFESSDRRWAWIERIVWWRWFHKFEFHRRWSSCLNFYIRLSSESLTFVFSIEVEFDESSNFDDLNPVGPYLEAPVDEGWVSSSGDPIEDGISLGNPLAFDENSNLDLYDQTFDDAEIAANQCFSNSSPMRKLRDRADACENFFNPSPEVKLPGMEDIELESKRKKYCSKSRWATFGNIPVCVLWPEDVNLMTNAVLGTHGPLALPLNGWVVVYGYLCKCLSWVKGLRAHPTGRSITHEHSSSSLYLYWFSCILL